MKRALVVLLLVAACGGGPEDDQQSPRETYVQAAEVICANANRELAEATKQRPAAIDAIPPYVGRIVEIARKNVTSLGSLIQPGPDAADLNAKLLDPLREQLEVAERYEADVAAAAKAKDSAAVLRLVTAPPTETRADLAWMRSFGFEECVTAADTAGATK